MLLLHFLGHKLLGWQIYYDRSTWRDCSWSQRVTYAQCPEWCFSDLYAQCLEWHFSALCSLFPSRKPVVWLVSQWIDWHPSHFISLQVWTLLQIKWTMGKDVWSCLLFSIICPIYPTTKIYNNSNGAGLGTIAAFSLNKTLDHRCRMVCEWRDPVAFTDLLE